MHTRDYLSLISSLKLQECSFQHKNSVFNLRQRRFVEVQLQPLNHVSEIGSVETHHVFGYARRPRAEKPGRTDSESIFFCRVGCSSDVAWRRTCLHHVRLSAPPRPPWCAARSPDRCGRRGPGSGPRTATLWVRWSWAATAGGSSPRSWIYDK